MCASRPAYRPGGVAPPFDTVPRCPRQSHFIEKLSAFWKVAQGRAASQNPPYSSRRPRIEHPAYRGHPCYPCQQAHNH